MTIGTPMTNRVTIITMIIAIMLTMAVIKRVTMTITMTMMIMMITASMTTMTSRVTMMLAHEKPNTEEWRCLREKYEICIHFFNGQYKVVKHYCL